MKHIMLVLCVIVLAACGGTNSGTSSIVSGTASQGAPIAGKVTLTDSKGAQKSADIGVDGSYRVVVDGMTAPYMLKAGGYYSVANSATTTNINPLTDVCVRSAAGTDSVDTIFSSAPTKIHDLATNMPALVTELKNSLEILYPLSVPKTQRDFMNGSLVIDQGADLVIKNLTINPAPSGYTIAMQNPTTPIFSGYTSVSSACKKEKGTEIIIVGDVMVTPGDVIRTKQVELVSVDLCACASFSTDGVVITGNIDVKSGYKMWGNKKVYNCQNTVTATVSGGL